jgi:stage III sporulation protein AE
MAFKNNQVSETGYYITYLLLFGLLVSSFIMASKVAADTINSILDFMKALLPTYFMRLVSVRVQRPPLCIMKLL